MTEAISPETVEAHRLEDDGKIPNNPDLPLLVYRGVLQPDADLIERTFAENGWREAWRDGVYDYHHYHSTAHEVLGVFRGEARLKLGGERGVEVAVQAGDVIVIPAGVGHCAESASSDFEVIGATHGGRHWDVCTGKPGERPEVIENIAAVPLPAADPVAGRSGPLTARWRQRC